MPKGVEHNQETEGAASYPHPIYSVMPKGVEHNSYIFVERLLSPDRYTP